MKFTTLVAGGLMLAASTAGADLVDCDHTAPHRLTANVAGASRIVIIGRAGSLRVTGANQAAVTAAGKACASDRDFLQEMRIEARRDGSDVVIEAIIPEKTMVFGFHQARLDMQVVVPENIPVRVKDGSGSVDVRGVASLDISDGSGEMEIRDVRGEVEVRDGSGSITIRGAGSVRIGADGSGSIDIRDIQRDVVIETDGSGSIDVTDVRGNFVVERDGSDSIDYDNVGGAVRIPSKKR